MNRNVVGTTPGFDIGKTQVDIKSPGTRMYPLCVELRKQGLAGQCGLPPGRTKNIQNVVDSGLRIIRIRTPRTAQSSD